MRLRSPPWPAWALLAALAGCAPQQEAAGPAPAAPQCRVGPDGGPPLAERGLGGTGATAETARLAERGLGGTGIGSQGRGPALAERGIGGTGATAEAARLAERGIGGTGIVGVITGFASICLAGQEVALDETVPVTVEAARASQAALRAGQVAVVEATGRGGALRALRVDVRYEVTGPVEAIGADGALQVAGQRVLAPARSQATQAQAAQTQATRREDWPRRGDWVRVSGLRRPDGAIQSTRLDSAPPGEALVHGVLQREAGTARIGGLELHGAPVAALVPGGSVTAIGRYQDGVLRAERLVPDLLATDPGAYFGQRVRAFVLEGFVAADGGLLRLGPDLRAAAPGGFGRFPGGRAVVELERRGDGGLQVSTLRAAGPGPGSGAPPAGPGGLVPRGGERAPMPHRGAMGGPPGWGGFGGMGPGGVPPGSPGPGGFGPWGGPGGGPGGGPAGGPGGGGPGGGFGPGPGGPGGGPGGGSGGGR